MELFQRASPDQEKAERDGADRRQRDCRSYGSPALPFRIAVGWTYNRTGSLFVVGLVHAVGNATTGGDGINAGFLSHLYPGNTTVTTAHLLAMFLLGLLVLGLTSSRLRGADTPDPQVRSPRAAATAHVTQEES